ncbi:MAG TPA: hypothetical protein VI959_01380 [Alphaproteobacteria bacterium]|nr:hypothetical protein [Alphaproteobacteria bacterium]
MFLQTSLCLEYNVQRELLCNPDAACIFIDQCLQQVNKRFQETLTKLGSKKELWERLISLVHMVEMPNFETMYDFIIRPPPIVAKSVI